MDRVLALNDVSVYWCGRSLFKIFVNRDVQEKESIIYGDKELIKEIKLLWIRLQQNQLLNAYKTTRNPFAGNGLKLDVSAEQINQLEHLDKNFKLFFLF